MANSNEYMAEYEARRYERRMTAAKAALGGKCTQCGATTNLEFDHIDPGTKLFTIADRIAGVSEIKLKVELEKCQLLCEKHHKQKHAGKHGTLSMRGCKCDLCRAAKSAYMKQYHATHPRKR